MKRPHLSLASAARLVAVLAILYAGTALAGPAEDYAEGAKRYAAGDLIGAMPLLRQSADAGHAAAQAIFGEILDRSDASEEAVAYFRKSAAQGNADGQFDLGTMLATGKGVDKNLAEARKWILLAAEQGHQLATNELALAYINGSLDISESERQSAQALRWIRAAADNGDLTAMGKLAAAYRAGEFGLAVDIKAAGQWEEKISKTQGIRKGRRNKRSNRQ